MCNHTRRGASILSHIDADHSPSTQFVIAAAFLVPTNHATLAEGAFGVNTPSVNEDGPSR